MESDFFKPASSAFREGFEKLLKAKLYYEIADYLGPGDASTRAYLPVAMPLAESKVHHVTTLKIFNLASSCRYFHSMLSSQMSGRLLKVLSV